MRASIVVVSIVVSGCARPSAPPVQLPSAPRREPVAAPLTPWTLPWLAHDAQLLGELGTVHREITTKSPEAQAFFDQGLALAYGFNHDEAARSFARAGQLDPDCALCFWGAAYTLGPNYNMPQLPERAALAFEALKAAERAAPSASRVEQALIDALRTRIPGSSYLEPEAMAPHIAAYAEVMRGVAAAHADDLDVQVLFAEALMNVHPWQLWSLDGKPRVETEQLVRTLESVLERAPEHAGANHFYIHAVEASPNPERALPAADRLAALMPGAGHTVHMPAHIYQRVGRYADASAANRRAVEVDQAYLARVRPLGYYPYYVAHNYGFLAYSAAMQGRAEESLAAARASAAQMPADVVCGMPGMDFFLSEPLLVLVRFGRWEELLAEPEPDARHPTLRALWHHGRGMALASTGKLDEAQVEVQAIRALSTDLPEQQLAGLNSGRQVLALAAQVVEARIMERTNPKRALALWAQAVALEDQLAYNEPADWFYPTRPFHGAALLDAGKAAEAEQVFRADLKRHPDNGWALFGLAQALRAQRKYMERETQQAFERAFRDADVKLARAAF